jgi:hypothetical protein
MNEPQPASRPEKATPPAEGGQLITEMLILPDGRVLVHSLTPCFAELLRELNPDCGEITSRTQQK